MSLMEMYVTDSLHLNAEREDNKTWIIHLANGKEIKANKKPLTSCLVWRPVRMQGANTKVGGLIT